MQFGLLLHAESHDVDAVMEEARRADEQGWDSIWMSDHLMRWKGEPRSDGPLDAFTLMTALGAVTGRVRLAWSMLNLSFRNPAVLARMLSTLDVITKGRVIGAFGSGWFKEEYAAYDVPLIDDHDERVEYGRAAVRLIKQLWTHPVPERVSYESKHVHARDILFGPAPYQKPHPPIWIGGDSDETIRTVKELADGWVMQRNASKEALASIMSAPDWPKRPMTLVRNQRIVVAETREKAFDEARERFIRSDGELGGGSASLEQFLEREIIGSLDDCLERIAEIESWGINYMRVTCEDAEHQERVAALILSRLQR